MRLDFNVLWVDDQPNHVQAQVRKISLEMENEGFEFKPFVCSTLEGVESAVDDDVFRDEIDLILVDWDLGNNVNGEDAIERIRETVHYRDVVFYSGLKPAEELRKKAYQKQLEGVFCASRENLVDEVVGVFHSLIRKVLDLDHTRGIVMGATSDIDHMVNSCLTLAHDKLSGAGKREFIRTALERVTAKVDNVKRQAERLQNDPSVGALVKAHMLFTSDDRLRMLVSILGMDEFSAHAASAEAIRSYREGVVAKRNTLGHAVLVPQRKSSSVVNAAGEAVDIDQMRTLRKLILNLRADFRALLEAMQA
ncbi:MAG: hypothetical protein B7Z66_11765 [Chromatiales bacterium 21-64-14]|nr:MAG: hypothetical protein B7Z66_11765 [Chromatiales bacterium 21-64-14]HQU16875.1 hypothetical protein [Gammaproteobacteria bacterium]